MKHYLLFSIVWLGVLIYLIYKIALSALPYNPLSPGMKEKQGVMSVVPEGWGFFTRNPREVDQHLYFYKNNKWVRNPNSPISSWRNTFGLNRFPRAQSVELGMILSNINDTCWKTASINLEHNNISDIASIEVFNDSPYPTITGRICILQQEPIPWAWSWNKDELAMPSKYVIVDVKNRKR